MQTPRPAFLISFLTICLKFIEKFYIIFLQNFDKFYSNFLFQKNINDTYEILDGNLKGTKKKI